MEAKCIILGSQSPPMSSELAPSRISICIQSCYSLPYHDSHHLTFDRNGVIQITQGLCVSWNELESFNQSAKL